MLKKKNEYQPMGKDEIRVKRRDGGRQIAVFLQADFGHLTIRGMRVILRNLNGRLSTGGRPPL